MPKTLFILRHGEAQASSPGGDKARTLTERGRADSARVGQRLAQLVVKPDLVLTSDADRARRTAEIGAEAAGYIGEIRLEPRLYAAWLDELLAFVRGLPDDAECVVLVGHNPGLTDLCAALSREGTPAYTLRTASLAHFELDATSWRRVREKTGTLLGVYTPGE